MSDGDEECDDEKLELEHCDVYGAVGVLRGNLPFPHFPASARSGCDPLSRVWFPK